MIKLIILEGPYMNNFLLIVLIAFFGCSSPPPPSGATPAESLFKEAQELIKDEHYLQATERLNTIRSKHPYSYYATHSELLQADILYKQENFVEATAAYILFKDFHPKHPKVSYVIWKIAESYFNQMPSSHDRDLNVGHEAIKYYRDILKRFPDSKHSKDAIKKIKKCLSLIEAKEKYIADFYYKTELYGAAQYRYLSIVQNFTSKTLVDHSLIRLMNSIEKLKNKSDCKKYYTMYSGMISKKKREGFKKAYNQCKKS